MKGQVRNPMAGVVGEGEDWMRFEGMLRVARCPPSWEGAEDSVEVWVLEIGR